MDGVSICVRRHVKRESVGVCINKPVCEVLHVGAFAAVCVCVCVCVYVCKHGNKVCYKVCFIPGAPSW